MPLYVAHYQTACLTRQDLERLASRVADAAGLCRSSRLYASFVDGRLIWLFTAPDRATLAAWLATLHLGNYEWLVRVECEGEDGAVRPV